MNSAEKQELEQTVADLQGRFGLKAIHRLGQTQTLPVPSIATGFPALDDALGMGGLPRGRLSEMMGIPTSGMATVALKVVAQAQASGGTAVYIDLECTFDPDYAARCGIQLSQLVLVRPDNIQQALAIVQDFAISGGMNVLVFDAPLRRLANPRPAQALSSALGRLMAPLGQTECALLFLTSLPTAGWLSLASYPNGLALPHYAAVRLLIQREDWLYQQRDIRGYRARVLVVKNKLGPAGQQVSLAITFNGTVAGDNP